MKLKYLVIALVVIYLVPFLASAEEKGQFRFTFPVSSTGTASTMESTNVSATINETITFPPYLNQSANLTVSGGFEETLDESPKSTAYSLHYIFPMGVGVGYTSQMIKYKVGLSTTKPTDVSGTVNGNAVSYTLASEYVSAVENIQLDLGYLDVLYAYRFLEDFSVTVGAGVPIIKAQSKVSVSSGTGSADSEVLDRLIQGAIESSSVENASAYSLFLTFGYELGNFEILASYRKTSFKADFKLDRLMSELLAKDVIAWNLDLNEFLVGLGYRF